MNDAQVRRTELPPTERLAVEGGVVSLQFMSSDRALATSGKDVGWIRVDGRPHYAAAQFVRVDGEWAMDPKQRLVCVVEDGAAGGRVPDDVARPTLALLEGTFRAWLEARPDIPARVAACEARAAEFRVENEIRDVESRLAQLRLALPRRRSEADEAEAEADRIAEAMGSGLPTP